MLTKIIVQLLFISLVCFSISAEASLTSEQKKFDKLQRNGSSKLIEKYQQKVFVALHKQSTLALKMKIN